MARHEDAHRDRWARYDWPTRRRAEGRTDGSGPDLPDWPTEDQLAAAEARRAS